MNDKHLRSKLIRLAHQNPKMRADILPLLVKTKQAAAAVNPAKDENKFVKTLMALEQMPDLIAWPANPLLGDLVEEISFSIATAVSGSSSGEVEPMAQTLDDVETCAKFFAGWLVKLKAKAKEVDKINAAAIKAGGR